MLFDINKKGLNLIESDNLKPLGMNQVDLAFITSHQIMHCVKSHHIEAFHYDILYYKKGLHLITPDNFKPLVIHLLDLDCISLNQTI